VQRWQQQPGQDPKHCHDGEKLDQREGVGPALFGIPWNRGSGQDYPDVSPFNVSRRSERSGDFHLDTAARSILSIIGQTKGLRRIPEIKPADNTTRWGCALLPIH